MIKATLLVLILSLASIVPANVINSAHTVYATSSVIAVAPKPQKKDYTVYITNTGERYHRGSCRHLRKSKIAIKKSDAIKQGYTPCKVCRP